MSAHGPAAIHPPPGTSSAPDQEGKHPTGHLAPFKGWIHSDGYTGFNDLFAKNSVHEMACMAHFRRYSYESKVLVIIVAGSFGRSVLRIREFRLLIWL